MNPKDPLNLKSQNRSAKIWLIIAAVFILIVIAVIKLSRSESAASGEDSDSSMIVLQNDSKTSTEKEDSTQRKEEKLTDGDKETVQTDPDAAIVNAYIDDEMHLILEMSDGSIRDEGYAGSLNGGQEEKQSYTVTFVDYNGAVLKKETVENGSMAAPPINPERDGFIFKGWSKSYGNVTEDTTAVAVYESETAETFFKVTFVDYDEKILYSQQVANGGAAAAPQSNPVREGYRFSGWDGDYSHITEDTTIVAQYEEDNSSAVSILGGAASAGQKDVQVILSIKNNPGIVGMTLTLSYDDSVLTLTNASTGSAFSPLTMTPPGKFKNGCRFIWDGVDLSSEEIKDGEILVLSFSVSDAAEAGVYKISADYNSGDIIDTQGDDLILSMKSGYISVE